MGGIPHQVTPNVHNYKMPLVQTELINNKLFVDNDTSGKASTNCPGDESFMNDHVPVLSDKNGTVGGIGMAKECKGENGNKNLLSGSETAPVIAELGTVSNRIPILLDNNGTVGGIGTAKQCKVEKGNNKRVIGELGTVSNPIPIDIVGEKSRGTVSIHTRNDFQLGTASNPIQIDKHTSVHPYTLSDRTGNGFENGSANNPIIIDETSALTHEQLERMERNRLRALCKRRAQQIKQRISESRNRPENVLILIRVIEAVIDMHDACVRPC
jgi:hypothetical protein